MTKYLMIALCVAFGLLQGCRYDSVEEISDAKLNCDLDSITFAGTIRPILESHCSDPLFGSCHEAGSEVGDYSSYDGVKGKVDNGGILSRVVLNRDMPPVYSEGPKGLPYCDMRKIQEWIKAGAPNN
jgi:hypothetical protein